MYVLETRSIEEEREKHSKDMDNIMSKLQV